MAAHTRYRQFCRACGFPAIPEKDYCQTCLALKEDNDTHLSLANRRHLILLQETSLRYEDQIIEGKR